MTVLSAIFKDPGFYIGSSGVFLTAISDFLSDYVSRGIGIVAGILGIIISCLLILEKIRQIRMLAIETKIKQRQLLDLEEEE